MTVIKKPKAYVFCCLLEFLTTSSFCVASSLCNSLSLSSPLETELEGLFACAHRSPARHTKEQGRLLKEMGHARSRRWLMLNDVSPVALGDG